VTLPRGHLLFSLNKYPTTSCSCPSPSDISPYLYFYTLSLNGQFHCNPPSIPLLISFIAGLLFCYLPISFVRNPFFLIKMFSVLSLNYWLVAQCFWGRAKSTFVSQITLCRSILLSFRELLHLHTSFHMPLLSMVLMHSSHGPSRSDLDASTMYLR
jgi:hypothetical protein